MPATIDPGTTPSVVVATESIASAHYQLIKKIDPTAASTTPIGTAANPEKVKPLRRGSADFDSGLVAVGTSATVVSASTVYPEAGSIENPTTGDIDVTITDTAGNVHAKRTVAAKSGIPWPIAISMVGVKALGSSVGAVINLRGTT